MKEKFFRKIAQHQSLYVIGFGAISFFLANIILKEKLSAVQYGEYSLLITYFSMIYIYGLLGLEQVFVKYSYIKQKAIIEINVFLAYLLFVAIICSTIASSSFFLICYGDIPLNSMLLVFTTLCMISLLLIYSIFRINSNFVLAQLIVNGFKIFLFFLILFSLVFDSINYNQILFGITIGIIFSFVIGLIYVHRKLDINYVNTINRKTILTVAFYFFISTFTFSVINFADRFIIDSRFGIEKFGDYFYLSNIFLAPFSILQNYIGFKKLVDYKNEFNVKSFNKNNLTNLYIGISLSILLLILYYCIIFIELLNFDFSRYFSCIVLIMILGIIKLYSSGIYPAFDIHINVKFLKISKVLILLISFTILGLAYVYAESLETIIVALIIIWVVKTLMLKYFLLFQVKSNLIE